MGFSRNTGRGFKGLFEGFLLRVLKVMCELGSGFNFQAFLTRMFRVGNVRFKMLFWGAQVSDSLRIRFSNAFLG